MSKNFHLPFQNMTQESWINLAIAAMLTFYILQIGFIIFDGKICQNIGSDYCAYWAAGRIINEYNITKVYDLDLLRQFQKEVYPQGNSPFFEPFGVMYLPIFLIPFKYLSLLKPTPSYLVWTFINLSGFILYLTYFAKKTGGKPLPNRLLLFIFLSLPVFVNFHEGQVNVWLMICAGEFIRAILTKNHFKAGLWLGGWLLKPQLLILIIPFLLFRKLFKAIVGFITSAGMILGFSIILIKPSGFLALINIFFEAGGGGVVSNPAAMINWRMIGWHVESFTSANIGWTIIIIGSLITTAMTVIIFRKNITGDSDDRGLEILGLFAATCAITWHSHLHMSMILIPPLIYMVIKKQNSNHIFTAWVFTPFFGELLGYLLAYLLQAQSKILLSYQIQALGRGLPGFIINLTMLGWAIMHYLQFKEQALE